MSLLNSLYHLSIHAYVLILKIVAPFNKKAKLWVSGRKDWENRLAVVHSSVTSDSPLAWFHCASLGEFEQGRPVIEAFRKEFPHFKILLTFFSPSGYEVRKNYSGADYIFYLPADTPGNAKKFINLTKPQIVFFVKYEFWRNYLAILAEQNVPILLFSAIFRPNQVFFKRYGSFYREVLFHFRHIFVQNQASIALLKNISFEAVTLAGDTRFDRVKQIADTVQQTTNKSTIFEQFKAKSPIFIVGSAWAEDMNVLIPMINATPALKFIIAPHEIHPQEIKSWQQQLLRKSICFSEIKKETNLAAYEVLLIDNIGMLSSLYQYAEFAYIGGSFGKGLHNILEAATFGIPLFFGNKAYHKFQEAQELIQLGGAFPIANTHDISLKVNDLLENEARRKEISALCKNYVLDNVGATKKIIDFVKSIL